MVNKKYVLIKEIKIKNKKVELLAKTDNDDLIVIANYKAIEDGPEAMLDIIHLNEYGYLLADIEQNNIIRPNKTLALYMEENDLIKWEENENSNRW